MGKGLEERGHGSREGPAQRTDIFRSVNEGVRSESQQREHVMIGMY